MATESVLRSNFLKEHLKQTLVQMWIMLLCETVKIHIQPYTQENEQFK